MNKETPYALDLKGWFLVAAELLLDITESSFALKEAVRPGMLNDADPRTEVRKQGFILLEVLIAAVVMAIGLLALAQLQVIAIRMNAYNRAVSEATLLAAAHLEYLQRLPSLSADEFSVPEQNPLLDTDDDPSDLEEISGSPDHVHPDYPIDKNGCPADPQTKRYGIFWNVADDTPNVPEHTAKTVAVTVTWVNGSERIRKHVTVATVIHE
ncbi:MAG TPA: prepilin-type N-terminal cleavage/methylation domain-containing protein [Thermodesulfobacteriota bacterium]|nr:prepilin-type N-terminal cleavage/methylation domain-containing protein [Thermodesulfobacteriota bacterium]HOC37995.1 prepilin-type N-terminal cleavage/methylation domain-containing protein [Thermodesulfobacteriota bacterium]